MKQPWVYMCSPSRSPLPPPSPPDLGLPSASGPSACLMHPTWAGDLFHPRYCTSLEDLPDTGIAPASLVSPALASRFFTTSATVEARWWKRWLFICQKWVLSLLKERCPLEKQVLSQWEYRP